MATYSSGYLDSVKITTDRTRYLTFFWQATRTSTGKTAINWKVYGNGGDTALSTFSIKLNGKTIYSAKNKVIPYDLSLLSWGEEIYYDDIFVARVEITVTRI
jgi:hypothetical protein